MDEIKKCDLCQREIVNPWPLGTSIMVGDGCPSCGQSGYSEAIERVRAESLFKESMK